jgi:hypothetical protein
VSEYDALWERIYDFLLPNNGRELMWDIKQGDVEVSGEEFTP